MYWTTQLSKADVKKKWGLQSARRETAVSAAGKSSRMFELMTSTLLQLFSPH
jgi:hypothetical protein